MQLKSRQISLLYRRLLYRNRLAPITVKFTKTNTFYDNILLNLSNEYLNILPYYDNTENILETHILLINDPIDFMQQQAKFKDLRIPKVLFFHDNRVAFMKKEDRYLFSKQIENIESYTFDPLLCDIIPNINLIKYGVPTNNNNNIEKNKSIIFIGNRENMDSVIYSNIKNTYKDAEFLSSEQICDINHNILMNYKICISMNSMFNNILASANQCCVISSLPSNNLNNYYCISNIEEMLNSIEYILNNYEQLNNINNSSIDSNYDYSIFTNKLTSIINTSTDRPLYHE